MNQDTKTILDGIRDKLLMNDKKHKDAYPDGVLDFYNELIKMFSEPK
jgi:hypothetical protein